MDTKSIPFEFARKNVEIKHLARDENRDFQIDLVKLDPDIEFDEHGHPDIEWIYVLKGSMWDENGKYEKDHFLINKKGSRHAMTTGPEGCEILACWCGRLDK
ncbi:hypothetical protein BVX95_00060 [archaeon D22]|nr:hypothetical protein BVX95_00060 [archaeon D22]